MPQSEHFYQLPTEMLEGNAFIHVSLSFCLTKGGSHVTIIHDALDITEQAHLRLFHYKVILRPCPHLTSFSPFLALF